MRIWLLALLWGCTSEPPPPIEEPKPVTPEPVTPEPEPEPVTPEPSYDASRCGLLDDDDAWMTAFLSRHEQLLSLPRSGLDATPLTDPTEHRLQIVVGEVHRDDDTPCVIWHPYRHDAEYVYPASSIKPMTGLAALQAVRKRVSEEPKLAGFTLETPLVVEPLLATTEAGEDVTVIRGRTTNLKVELEASMIRSSNTAYNFLYDLAGREALHDILWSADLESTRIAHRFARSKVPGAQGMAPRVLAKMPQGDVEIFPERLGAPALTPRDLPRTKVGRAHKRGGTNRPGPIDYRFKNDVSLFDMTRSIAWVADPALVPKVIFPDIPTSDRELLREAMEYVPFDWSVYYPIRAGVMQVVPGDDIVYINKVGQATGFRLDVAYVERVSTGAAFLVGVVIYANPNGVLNDDRYGYDSHSGPFFAALGTSLARELLEENPE